MKNSLPQNNDLQTLSAVTLRFINDIAVITVNNPPVNAGSHAVRLGIVNALKDCNDPALKAVILIGEGKGFSGGSDVKEFGSKLLPPEVPTVIRTIEEHPIPVIAAIHGFALGGGLELALGCDYRIALSGTHLALPEVLLGMIPGAGGTQRLPRLTGQIHALDLICSGKRVTAQSALEMGFVDHVCNEDLLTGVINFVEQNFPLDKRLSISQPVPAESDADIDEAIAKILKRNKGRKNISEAIRLVKASSQGGAESVLLDERQTFNELRLGDDAFALRHLFFAEKIAPRIDGIDNKIAKNISSVGVIGGGTMGQGIAKAILNIGLNAMLIERDQAAADKTKGAIESSYDNLVSKGIITAQDKQSRLEKLTCSTGFEGLKQCDLVIEAVFEDMAVKQALFKELEAHLSSDAIIATNTSYLDINQMSSALKHKERVVGLHFFSPADRMKLLEVVRTSCTAPEVLATSLNFAKALGKQAIISNVAEGFIGNRIYAAYRRRAELLVLDGASPYDVDKAITNFGFAMGPFAVSDLSGLDIAWAMRKRKAADRDPKERYVSIADKLCEAGYFGRKSGQGWYDYSDGKAQPSEKVTRLIESTRLEEGIQVQAFDERLIQQQLLAAMVNEAACLLSEGVAQRASDIDVAMANGYGFPRHKGGPIYWASQQDKDELAEMLSQLAQSVGYGFNSGPVEEIVSSLTEKGNH